MRFLLNVNQFGERGTETATFEVGSMLKAASHEVFISYPPDGRNQREVQSKFAREFELIEYSKVCSDEQWLRKNIDFGYLMKVDGRDGKKFKGIWNAVHTVFREDLPHGNTYSYISKWLADEMRQMMSSDFLRTMRGQLAYLRGCQNALKFDGVPYVVNMPPLESVDVRRDFNISDSCFLMIRYGGMGEFDIPWVQAELVRFLDENADAHFLAINTNFFAEHPQISYAEKIINVGYKAAVLESADVFLHARSIGETFGMSIVEAMQMGTDVLSCAGGDDQNHVVLLQNGSHLFSSPEQMRDLLSKKIRRWRTDGRERSAELMAQGNMFRPKMLEGQYLRVLFGQENEVVQH